MNNKNLPPVSVIIPVFNEEKRLYDCLNSIFEQDYPQDKIELIIVDDCSTDDTVAIAKKFRASVITNGSHNIEKGKSIGLSKAKNDLVFLLDADNRLPHKKWLSKMIIAMTENPQAVGAEAIWFHYDGKHTISDRYSELFGVNDPMAYYLKRRDRLMATEKEWRLPGDVIKETENYFLVKFNRENLLTVGSQGFLTKKSLLLKTKWKPYLFHMDSNMDLINLGHNEYLMMKDSIIHLHSNSLRAFIKKLKRNFTLFLEQGQIRRYTWRTKPIKLILVTLAMVTFVVPFTDAIKGYIKKPDLAWFLHPFFCFFIPSIYFFYIIKGLEFKKIFNTNV